MPRDKSSNSDSYGPLRDHTHHILNVNKMTVVNDVQTGAAVGFFAIWNRVGSRGFRSRHSTRPEAMVSGRPEE